MSATETYSFLPPLDAKETQQQIEHILQKHWVPMIEYAENPVPDEFYWKMWPLPKPDELSVAWLMAQLEACRRRYPYATIKITGYDKTHAKIATSFVAYGGA